MSCSYFMSVTTHTTFSSCISIMAYPLSGCRVLIAIHTTLCLQLTKTTMTLSPSSCLWRRKYKKALPSHLGNILLEQTNISVPNTLDGKQVYRRFPGFLESGYCKSYLMLSSGSQKQRRWGHWYFKVVPTKRGCWETLCKRRKIGTIR